MSVIREPPVPRNPSHASPGRPSLTLSLPCIVNRPYRLSGLLLPYYCRANSTAPTGYLDQLLGSDGSPIAASDDGSHAMSDASGAKEGAAVGGAVDTLVGAGGGDLGSGKKLNILRTLWEFSRPHTMIGTAIAIPAVGVFAAPPGVS